MRKCSHRVLHHNTFLLSSSSGETAVGTIPDDNFAKRGRGMIGFFVGKHLKICGPISMKKDRPIIVTTKYGGDHCSLSVLVATAQQNPSILLQILTVIGHNGFLLYPFGWPQCEEALSSDCSNPNHSFQRLHPLDCHFNPPALRRGA